MPESKILLDRNGQPTTYIGPDGVEFFRVRVLQGALKVWQRCGILPYRGVSHTKMLAQASAITGKPYSKTQTSDAIADLQLWLSVCHSSLPVEKES